MGSELIGVDCIATHQEEAAEGIAHLAEAEREDRLGRYGTALRNQASARREPFVPAGCQVTAGHDDIDALFLGGLQQIEYDLRRMLQISVENADPLT